MHNIPTMLWVMSLIAMWVAFIETLVTVFNDESSFAKLLALAGVAVWLISFFALVRL